MLTKSTCGGGLQDYYPESRPVFRNPAFLSLNQREKSESRSESLCSNTHGRFALITATNLQLAEIGAASKITPIFNAFTQTMGRPFCPPARRNSLAFPAITLENVLRSLLPSELW